jgi:hypothetical protein
VAGDARFGQRVVTIHHEGERVLYYSYDLNVLNWNCSFDQDLKNSSPGEDQQIRILTLTPPHISRCLHL